MGIKQEIDFSELAAVTQKLADIKIKAEDIRGEAANGIRLILQEDVDYRFETAPPTETGGIVYGGVQWNSLNEAYLGRNPRRYGGQILRDTGELQQSLTNEASPYNIYEVGESYLVFGSALAKAGKLQKQRKFIFWHPQLLEKIAEFLANYLSDE
jgi:hypothetical protein